MAKTGPLSGVKRGARSNTTAERSANGQIGAADSAARGQLEYAYQRLKDAIMNGVYMPHQRLIEAEVTQALGVSRTTLRAALIRLHEEGLVEIEVNRGARVRAFSLDEAVQILRVREVLEGLAAGVGLREGGPAANARQGGGGGGGEGGAGAHGRGGGRGPQPPS